MVFMAVMRPPRCPVRMPEGGMAFLEQLMVDRCLVSRFRDFDSYGIALVPDYG